MAKEHLWGQSPHKREEYFPIYARAQGSEVSPKVHKTHMQLSSLPKNIWPSLSPHANVQSRRCKGTGCSWVCLLCFTEAFPLYIVQSNTYQSRHKATPSCSLSCSDASEWEQQHQALQPASPSPALGLAFPASWIFSLLEWGERTLFHFAKMGSGSWRWNYPKCQSNSGAWFAPWRVALLSRAWVNYFTSPKPAQARIIHKLAEEKKETFLQVIYPTYPGMLFVCSTRNTPEWTFKYCWQWLCTEVKPWSLPSFHLTLCTMLA